MYSGAIIFLLQIFLYKEIVFLWSFYQHFFNIKKRITITLDPDPNCAKILDIQIQCILIHNTMSNSDSWNFFFKGEYIAEVVEFFYFFTGIWILRIKN